MTASLRTLLVAIPVFFAIAGAYLYFVSDYFGASAHGMREAEFNIAESEASGSDACAEYLKAEAASATLLRDTKTLEERRNARLIACSN